METAKNLKRRNALGRGLGALLQQTEPINETELTQVPSINSVSDIDVDTIETNPFQPRTSFDRDALNELAESIRVQGIIQPITVRQLDRDHYQLISGERRLQASKLAGLKEIPAYVRTANDQQMLEMALIENIQRENLNAMEIALSYQRLISECSLKQEELGERVGKNRATVNNYLRLLKLPPDIQAALRDNRLSMGHARAIINVENIEAQLAIFHKIIEEDLSVRAVENMVRNLAEESGQKKKKERKPLRMEYTQLQYKLSSFLSTKVTLKSNDKNQGEIRIPFVSEDDLNRILEILSLS
ncbi:ParB/RepB/Spo0J family partition protein [Cytophagaceae bacterium DM2B3-1]|uniref:ParB/RepB/Spo0J family partition protein n=2 Tax=Xanthocytophaga flava TaxID=3048013 RepID=A0AAE3QQH9_9BACT|nr:ParB/RepB/Spo0J family partition protein [Xanthocytophaga flavus]MDJ1470569.1 ParB/RepB/Spo0J family partition protein [Xanthocytophaga flavus]MDJ1481625.1 ParB/RepB/Spo0J family partition protein [Xanthocytophaga flavus]MDJ1491588.1 ParB/RepB/Spo0J family partition protein [Xanthocytophaga flavus]